MTVIPNATVLAMMVRSMPSTGEYGPLKIIFAIIQTFLIAVGTPLFIHEREQPMVKYRSWTLNLVGCISITIRTIVDACTSMDGWVHYSFLPFSFWLRSICLIVTVCCYAPTYLRHYYLLRLPILQTKLLDYETMVDPVKYRLLSRSLIRTKFLSSEMGAWTFFFINFIPLMIIGIVYLLEADFNLMAIGMPNPTDLYLVKMGVAVVLMSSIFVIWYGSSAPKENFRIMQQFYAVTVSSLVTATVLLLGLNSGNLHTNRICLLIATIFTFLILCIDIIMPLQFLITNQRYNLVRPSLSLRKSKKSQRKGSGDSPRRKNQYADALNGDHTAHDLVSSSSHNTSTISSSSSKKGSSWTIPKIIDDPLLRKAFCQYLAREFSMESLLFLETIKLYKQKVRRSPTKETIKSLSDKIMAEFIAPNSVNEALSVYDDAADHIEEMLALNHLRKFRDSPIFNEITLV
ncbi:hypothetical protein BASA60_008335 [Batrachochytrium salamandrivorans]|nr:hypothetical protein BASA60_008335 [Batrachochytrium salamandrivorans]